VCSSTFVFIVFFGGPLNLHIVSRHTWPILYKFEFLSLFCAQSSDFRPICSILVPFYYNKPVMFPTQM
jgi:hypothetical protein